MNTKSGTCPFCDITQIKSDVDVRQLDGEVIYTFAPLNPVVRGHHLVVPRRHVDNAQTDPRLTGIVMDAAAHFSRYFRSANLITSIGAPATQTVHHLHVHVVPRQVDDGLTLPWTEGPTRDADRIARADGWDRAHRAMCPATIPGGYCEHRNPWRTRR